VKSTLVILTLAASTLVVAAAIPSGVQGPFRVEFTKFPGWPGKAPGFPVARVCSGRAIRRFFDTSPVSPSGRYVVFNGVERGTRHVYLADLSSLLFPES
jgi:hypothetical protein